MQCQQRHDLARHGLQVRSLARVEFARLMVDDAQCAQRKPRIIAQERGGIEACAAAIGQARHFQRCAQFVGAVNDQRAGLQDGLCRQRVFARDALPVQGERGQATLPFAVDEMDRCRRAGAELRGHGGERVEIRFGRGIRNGMASQCCQPVSFIPGR